MAAQQQNHQGKQPPPRRRREFTTESECDARTGPRHRPADRQIAKELGIHDSALGNWVRQAQIDDGERAGLISDERARLGELERENARVPMERDLPKRTVAFWVTWTSTP